MIYECHTIVSSHIGIIRNYINVILTGVGDGCGQGCDFKGGNLGNGEGVTVPPKSISYIYIYIVQ